ncbi:GntR family transcriptional regulator [Mariniluteicoccus flavus]
MEHAASAATTVADEIRQEVLAGNLPPGARLDEVSLGAAHGVSRNTLREAFRLLAHDRLVEHRPHRGVFVRTIDEAEAHEIYAVRRMVEVGALRELAAHAGIPTPVEIARIEDAVGAAERARDAGDWATVGTMNGSFHLALTALAGNRVVDRLMSILVTEIRLFFLTAGTPDEVHDRYLDENRRILELVRAGDLPRAAVALETYLLDAERHLVGP